MADGAEYARLMEPVARKLLGAPRATHRGGMEWRYGNFESLKIEIDTGLFHDYEHDEKGGVLDFIKWHLGLPDRAEARRWLEQQGYLPREEKQPFEPGITYRYCDQDGTVVLKVSRWSHNGERRFTQRAPDPEHPGEWIKPSAVKGGAKRIPYRLPELLAAIAEGKMVFFVEGEKDVDRLREVNITATTNSEGGNNHKWLPEIAPYFAGADVVIIPDYDLKGQQHGERIAKLLTGTAKRVRLFDLSTLWPEIKIKNDVSDWLNNGGTAEALIAAVEKLTTWGTQKQQRSTAKVIPFPGGFEPSWWKELGKGVKGGILTDLRNVSIVLRSDSRLVNSFAFDEMAQTPLVVRDLPLAPDCAERSVIPRPVTEDDVGCLQHWLQYQQIRGVGFDTVRQAIELRAFDRRFHPIRDWLDKLESHGKGQLNSWLHDFFGCTDNEYHRQIGRMFLIAMVARIYQPGCQSDYMLVLEGPQGEVKSQACRALAGDEYFSDNLPEINGDAVRLSMHLRGKWLVEISELSSFKRADAALLKSFITRQVEIFIPKYGRMERREPRQCLFVGTTNDDDYLKDETGNRRFWPCKCNKIEKEKLLEAREQLFAEAVERYRHNEQWWPEREIEKQIIVPVQIQRLSTDAWLAPVRKWLAGKLRNWRRDCRSASAALKPPEFNLMQIAEGALDFKKAQFSALEQRRLTAVMRLIGWKHRHTMRGNVWRRS